MAPPKESKNEAPDERETIIADLMVTRAGRRGLSREDAEAEADKRIATRDFHLSNLDKAALESFHLTKRPEPGDVEFLAFEVEREGRDPNEVFWSLGGTHKALACRGFSYYLKHRADVSKKMVAQLPRGTPAPGNWQNDENMSVYYSRRADDLEAGIVS